MSNSEIVVMLLTVDEAETIAAILAKVGGDPDQSPRKHADSVMRMLQGVGIEWFQTNAYKHLNSNDNLFFRTEATQRLGEIF